MRNERKTIARGKKAGSITIVRNTIAGEAPKVILLNISTALWLISAAWSVFPRGEREI